MIAGVTPIATLTPLPWVEIFGSGKLDTPCERMHAEYATAWLPGEDSPPPVEPAAVELVVDVVEVCVPRLATPPLGDAAAAARHEHARCDQRRRQTGHYSQADRRPVAVISVFDVVLHFRLLLSSKRSCAELLVRDRRFREGIAARRWTSPPAKPC